MSLKYRNQNGVETPVAGLNGTSGELVPSTIYKQSGTLSITGMGSSTDKKGEDFPVTFSTPMPDADYEVTLTNDNYLNCWVKNASKTVNGFTVRCANYAMTNGTGNASVTWTAFKLIANEDRELDEQAIAALQAVVPSDASSSNKLVDNNRFSGIVSNVDCNTLTTAGIYSTAGANIPESGFWFMVVVNYAYINATKYIMQIAYSVADTNKNYRRVSSDGGSTWSAWNRIITQNLITSSVTNGSTAPVTSGGVYNSIVKSKIIRVTFDATNKVVNFPDSVNIVGVTYIGSAQGVYANLLQVDSINKNLYLNLNPANNIGYDLTVFYI